MAFDRYNTQVRVGDATNGVVLPIDAMTIRAVPYVPAGGTVVELFDGNRILKQPTYGYRIELDWGNLRNHYEKVWDAVNHMIGNDGVDFYAYYDRSIDDFRGGYVVPNVIPDLSAEDFGIIFEGRVRARPASLLLKSKSQGDITPKSWITS